MSVLAIHDLLETSLYVADVARSAHFYSEVLGLDIIHSDDRITAMGVGAQQVLLLFNKDAPPDSSIPHGGHGELHLAFAISHDQLNHWEKRLTTLGVDIEYRRTWPRGGKSLYFRDPDRHLVELATPGVWSVY